MKYKLIKGYSMEDLERNVNFFLGDTRQHFVCAGAPQMFGHSEYVQALETLEDNT